MAVVRLTQKLVRQIEGALESNASSITKQKKEPSIADGNAVIQAFCDQYPEVVNSHSSFKSNVGIIILSTPELGTVTLACSRRKIVLPAVLSGAGGNSSTLLRITDKTPLTIPETTVLSLLDLQAKNHALDEEYSSLVNTIKVLIKRCTTLKQLIEAWPQIQQFVPQDALDKHNAHESKRRKKGIYLEDEQTQELNQALLTLKMTT